MAKRKFTRGEGAPARLQRHRLFSIGNLPKGYGLVTRQTHELRSSLESALLAMGRVIEETTEAIVGRVVQMEQHRLMIARELRLNAGKHTPYTLMRLLDKQHDATIARDKALAELQLGKTKGEPQTQVAVWGSEEQQSQAARPAEAGSKGEAEGEGHRDA